MNLVLAQLDNAIGSLTLTAQEAENDHMVNHVMPAEELKTQTLRIAQAIARNAPLAELISPWGGQPHAPGKRIDRRPSGVRMEAKRRKLFCTKKRYITMNCTAPMIIDHCSLKIVHCS
jgi:hypothetical protein